MERTLVRRTTLRWWHIASAIAANIAGGLLLFSQESSAAYIDPGLGVMLVQGLVAAFFGFLFYIRSFRQAVVRVFSRIFGKEATPAAAAATGESKDPKEK